MVRQRDAEQRGGQHDPPVRAARRRRVVRVLALRIGHQRSQRTRARTTRATSSEVEGVGVGGGRDAPGDGRQREARRHPRARTATARRAGAAASTVTPTARRHSSADSRFIRNAGSPRGCRTTDASQPSEDVRREPRRVHRAHQRQHGLGLGRVPREDPRQERGPVDQQGRHGDERARRGASGPARAAVRPAGYQPRSWPQVTPHRLTSPPATSSTTAISRGRPSDGRAAPSATIGSRNGRKSSENR